MEIHCNLCHNSLAPTSTCYYTKCYHLYCESCACYAFQDPPPASVASSGGFGPSGGIGGHGSHRHHTSHSSQCLICHQQLYDGDIKIIYIGMLSSLLALSRRGAGTTGSGEPVEGTSSSLLIDNILQYLFQSNNWSLIMKNLLEINSCILDITSFLYQQLLYEINFHHTSYADQIQQLESSIEEKVSSFHLFILFSIPSPSFLPPPPSLLSILLALF
jgi:hypothetical protein